MVHKNIAYSAVYWTQTVPGSDSSWSLHLNCDGTDPGTAPALSLRNPMDPVRLEVACVCVSFGASRECRYRIHRDSIGCSGSCHARQRCIVWYGCGAINALSDDVKGWANAHNLIFTTLAPQATFGWSLSIGEFAYDTHSGRQSVWDEASVFTLSPLLSRARRLR